MNGNQATERGVGVTTHRVNYSEVDQMGVVYHARYLVWLDVARTEFLRTTGMSYRELEELGLRLVVSEATLRFRRSARYDDPIRVRTWVRERASRRVTFGYAVEHAERGELLVTASTALLVTDAAFAFARLPDEVADRLVPIPDPVRL
jgi:acyl-CoA thioester hydrolase